MLVMPTDACNMNCVYCFHKPYHVSIDKMSLATVKRILDITTPYYESINIIWHGGEPLLMGLDFFKDVVDLEREYSCKLKNSIQSNLTVLTDDMADFFVANNFNISSSFDGINNRFTRGSDERILQGRQKIVNRGSKCGIIMVVSNKNIDTLIESYQYFNENGINFSLNLYLPQQGDENDSLKLDLGTAVTRINELFDYWLNDKKAKVNIRYFSNILDYIFFKKKTLCTYTSCLGRWIAIRYNGDIVPCNRTFPDEYIYGNVHDYGDIGEAFESDGFKRLIQEAIVRRNKCKDCQVFDFCNGGCNNVALNENGITNNQGLSCKILISVYNHINDVIGNMDFSNIHIENVNPFVYNHFIKMQVK